ncbi:hypothetical protein AB1Y20_002900 [Prymnesium parvum]|uniref:Uncharacterized protein n=1 Tax=Prymnesium parvum TaxID=97485 RepID=A0AB34JBQ3_PRYPA
MPWATFLEGCLWGLPTPATALPDCARMVANGPHMRAMAALWELEPLRRAEVPLLALVAFLTTAAELPEARDLANEATS